MSADLPLPAPPSGSDARDEDFAPHSWEELKRLIGRWPSEVRRYRTWGESIRAEYGSVLSFICKERLQWTPAPDGERPPDSAFRYANPVPFEDEDDYKILLNDWPYRWEKGVVHMCVWLKNKLPADAEFGKITPEGRELVDRFIQRTFIQPLGPSGSDRVLWFKNWTALQSVAALEHIHVLVRDVPEAMIRKWTDSDETIAQR